MNLLRLATDALGNSIVLLVIFLAALPWLGPAWLWLLETALVALHNVGQP